MRLLYFTRKITTVGVGWVAQLSQRCRKTLLNSPLLAGLSLHSPPMYYGPEFASHLLGQWADEHQVRLQFIEPGKPIQNAFIKCFNNRLREEYLNEHAFVSLDHARRTIEQWRAGYNSERPHSTLVYLSPEEFASGNRAIRSKPAARTAWPAKGTLPAHCKARRSRPRLSQFFRPQPQNG